MKKTLVMFLGLLSSIVMLEAAELKIREDGGAVLLDGATEIAKVYPFFGTRHSEKWFQPGGKLFTCKVEAEAKGLTRFSGKFPADDQGGEVAFTGSWTKAEDGSVVFDMKWETTDISNVRQASLFVEFPMALIQGKAVQANGETHTVENISKYGTLVIGNTKLALAFFQDVPERRFSLLSENNCNLAVSNLKDRSVTFRINDIPFYKKNNIRVAFHLR